MKVIFFVLFTFQEGQPIFQWPNHIHDENGTLYFQQVKKSDSGSYTCVATNSQGLINTTIYVDVIGEFFVSMFTKISTHSQTYFIIKPRVTNHYVINSLS